MQLNADSAALSDDLQTAQDDIEAKNGQIEYQQKLIDTQHSINLEPVQEQVIAGFMQNLLDNLSDRLGKTDVDMGAITGLSAGILDVTDVNYVIDTASIDGTAAGEDDILAYARALRESGQFSTVVISSIERQEDSFTFNIVVTW